jgi:hypothetical protein
MRAFDASGQWWRPGNQDNSIGGTISFSPDKGATLALIGTFTDSTPFDYIVNNNEAISIPVIHGVTTDGEHITLIESAIAKSKVVSGGYPTLVLSPRFVFIGGHFASIEDIHSHRLIMSCDYLQDWFGRTGFTRKWSAHPSDADEVIAVSYRHPEPATAITTIGDILINTSISASLSSYATSIQQRVSIDVSSPQDRTFLSWLQSVAIPIQGFLSFATNHPNSITDFRIVMYRDEEGVLDGVEDTRPDEVKVEVLFEPVFHSIRDEKDLHENRMLFNLSDVRSFSATINAWFDLYERLSPALNLYLGSMYRPAGYMDTRFLITLQTIETIHYHLSEEGTRGRTSLSKALDRLFEISSAIMIPLVGNRKRFLSDVVNYRNHLVHYASPQGTSIDYGRLYWINEALRTMVRCVILIQLGFSSDECLRLFDRSRDYLSIRSLGNLAMA